MSVPYAALALVIGLVGFAAIEASGVLLGMMTALTPFVWLDAVAYALGTLLLGLAFAPLFRRARGVGVAGAVVAFLLLYAPLVAVIAGVLDLTVGGGWGLPGLVRSAFIAGPVNLIVTFVLELPFVALPLGIVAALLLWRRARGGARGATTPKRRPTPAASRSR
jgi:hypothetical protein